MGVTKLSSSLYIKKLSAIGAHMSLTGLNVGSGNGMQGVASPETLGVNFDEATLRAFVTRKAKQLKELDDLSQQGRSNIDLSKYLDPFEQVLAHEAFHIYQFLSSSVISENAAALRRKLRIEGKVLAQLCASNTLPIESKELLCSPQVDQEIEDYFIRVVDDTFETSHRIDLKNSEEDLSLREIIEAGAVAFQLISQNDYLGEKIPITSDVYTAVWRRFSTSIDIDQSNPTSVLVGRLVLLFACDVHLKFSHNDFKNNEDIFDTLELIKPIIDKFPSYVEEFNGDTRRRDEILMQSLGTVEPDEAKIEGILDFCGSLSTDDQLKFYVNIRLYGDVYKRVALAGAQTRRRPQNNKNRAVNVRLKSLFSYWDSDFTIPCVLSSFEHCSKFSTIWMNIGDVQFIDEVEKIQFNVESDNEVLGFMSSVTSFIRDPNSGARCCMEHGHTLSPSRLANCEETDSINQRCILNFGKSFGEIVKHDRY